MGKDISTYVQGCVVCTWAKSTNQPTQEIFNLCLFLIALALDFIGLQEASGKDTVLTIMN